MLDYVVRSRAQQVRRDDQRAQSIFGHKASGVADDVRVAGIEAEHSLDSQPGIHTSDDGKLLGRRHRQMAQREALDVLTVRSQIFIVDSHFILLLLLTALK